MYNCVLFQRIVQFQVCLQPSIYENKPIDYIIICPGQENTPQNSYSNYQYGSNGQPAPYTEVVYYPHPLPETYRYPKEECATLHNSPGESCSSTVCASVFYNFEGNNKPRCDCRKSECDCSIKREYLEYENNSGCMCKNSGNKHKSSDNCFRHKSSCNSECRCNKQNYDCDSCQNDFCISRYECETLGDECGRCSCLEKPIRKCCFGEKKSHESHDAILDGIKAIEGLLTMLLYEACDCVWIL